MRTDLFLRTLDNTPDNESTIRGYKTPEYLRIRSADYSADLSKFRKMGYDMGRWIALHDAILALMDAGYGEASDIVADLLKEVKL